VTDRAANDRAATGSEPGSDQAALFPSRDRRAAGGNKKARCDKRDRQSVHVSHLFFLQSSYGHEHLWFAQAPCHHARCNAWKFSNKFIRAGACSHAMKDFCRQKDAISLHPGCGSRLSESKIREEANAE
jgi:hypothetical protein